MRNLKIPDSGNCRLPRAYYCKASRDPQVREKLIADGLDSTDPTFHEKLEKAVQKSWIDWHAEELPGLILQDGLNRLEVARSRKKEYHDNVSRLCSAQFRTESWILCHRQKHDPKGLNDSDHEHQQEAEVLKKPRKNVKKKAKAKAKSKAPALPLTKAEKKTVSGNSCSSCGGFPRRSDCKIRLPRQVNADQLPLKTVPRADFFEVYHEDRRGQISRTKSVFCPIFCISKTLAGRVGDDQHGVINLEEIYEEASAAHRRLIDEAPQEVQAESDME